MILDGLVAAIRTLTVFPVPGRDTERKFFALPWFMAVGAVFGMAQYCVAQCITQYVNGLAFIAGLLLTALHYYFSGAMHLDGLADTADAFGTIHSREKSLSILKDPHLGSFGVCAVIVAVLWRMSVYQRLFDFNTILWIVYASALSRTVAGLVLSLCPYARGREGSAHGYKSPIWISFVLLVQIIGIECLIGVINGWRLAGIPFLCGLIADLLICFLYMKRIGGITGDCIGTAIELFEMAFLTGAIACRNALFI